MEAAGQAFEQMIARKLRGEAGEAAEEEPLIDEATRAHAEKMRKKHADEHASNVSRSALLTEDPYELLGLGHLRWRATEDQIKKACALLFLMWHIDDGSVYSLK